MHGRLLLSEPAGCHMVKPARPLTDKGSQSWADAANWLWMEEQGATSQSCVLRHSSAHADPEAASELLLI